MKKLFTLIGIALLSLLLVVGCGKNNAVPPQHNDRSRRR